MTQCFSIALIGLRSYLTIIKAGQSRVGLSSVLSTYFSVSRCVQRITISTQAAWLMVALVCAVSW